MKARPTIFLSGVSHEFGSFRDAVETEIQMKGCFAENQPSFAPDYRTVEEMLRRKLTEADAVIHIVGFRFGAEPNQRPPDVPRRSYTQMEFNIAREMQKPIFVFISNDGSVRDAARPEEKPEDAEATALQLAHRETVQKTNCLYYFFKDKSELCKLAAEIPIVAQAGEFKVDISYFDVDKYAPAELIGRDDELALLNDAWLKVRRAESPRPDILTFVAIGGEGKTALVGKWAAEIAHQDWPGCDAAFAWSFSNQGTREQLAASSDLFLKAALTFFGDDADKAFAASNAGAFEKGQRLARIVGQWRSLLILDGLEPLQYAPTSPTPGELKDQGIAALLKGLAANSHGLCVVTTRYSLPDLKMFWQNSAPEVKLLRLSRDAGIHLLETLGVNGTTKEFETLVEDVKGHALTLTLLGGFLQRAFHGDIRQRDRVKFEKADEKMDGGHAFRTMAAYEQWLLGDGGEEGRREVAVLRLMGLFDRPADAGCLAALRREPIPDLTEPLAGLADDDWEYCLSGLEAAKLLTVNRDASGALDSLDAHPHLREYFAKQLRDKNPDAWRTAHRRLYEHLCTTTKEGDQPTLEDLQPLYQAVGHGCQAGLQQKACDEVYFARIYRGYDAYSVRKLGAFGSDLGAVACFFEQPWNCVSPELTEGIQAWLLNQAGAWLRALGRLTEALEPMRVSGEMDAKAERWQGAAISYSNLSELELTLGEVAGAVGDAEKSVTYADRSGDAGQRMISRTTYADALHQAGRGAEATPRFHEAEQMQAALQAYFPLLYSLQGFWYCNLLLVTPERAAWQKTLNSSLIADHLSVIDSCRAVSQRAAQTLKWEEGMRGAPLLDFALHHLTLGHAALYEAILEGGAELPLGSNTKAAQQSSPTDGGFSAARRELDAAVDGLRRAGEQWVLPAGLLTRAWLRFLTGACIGPGSAKEDLDEAWEIAERGPMKLFLADIHLHRARLFFREEKYPWRGAKNRKGELVTNRTAKDDLDDAECLINTCGYHRRDEELADAKKALGQ
jgi:hypothetical protein